MSWPDRGRVSDHFSATSQAGGEADQSHEVRHATGRRHRLQIKRLQAARVTPCTTTPEAPRALRGRLLVLIGLYRRLSTWPGGLAVHGR
jgi:hypothetical protein